MNLDEFQSSWRSQDVANKVSINADALLNEVRHRQHSFRRTIFWRDVREIGVAALQVPMFIFGGLHVHWTLHLGAFGCFVVAAFMLLDRRRQKKKKRNTRTDLHGSLKACALTSLEEVSHQIWLLKNVHWWYLLPLGLPMLIFFGWSTLNPPGHLLFKVFSLVLLVGFVGLLYLGIYWLNQSAVKKSLEPRRLELENLLNELEPERHPSTMKSKRPLVPLLLVVAAIVIAIVVMIVRAPWASKSETSMAIDYSEPTSQMLEAIRVKHNFPALAAAVVVDGKIVATNAVGFRKHGGKETVTADDKFHIGSVTKSMTATVAAMLVEQEKISWTTTIGDSFSDLGDRLHSDYRDVTLEQLLAHRGGAPGNAPGDLWRKAWNASGTPAEQRLEFVHGLLTRKPANKPGTQYAYSNQGYAIAGVMLEKATGSTWEELMRTMLFKPLGMNSAGFGAPAALGELDQPWGHTKGLLAGMDPVPPGPRADNPPAIGPAGTVHCSLGDLAKYVAFHLSGEQGASELLNAESFKKLHTSAGDDYALGWVVLEREWAGGRTLMHNGSNTMFYVVVWMAPELNSAVIVATNVGVDGGFAGCDEAAVKLINQFFPK